MSRSYEVFLVAGEASSDAHAASLLSELKAIAPVRCFGVGGKALKMEGMEVIVDSSRLSVVGATDWLDKAGEVWRSYQTLKRVIRERRPDCAVLLDLPDFNLGLARKLKRLGVPVVYYISPQVWAWRRYRVRTIRRCVDQMLVLFPFEKTFYDEHGIRSDFVGHPLLESVDARPSWRAQGEVESAPRIALLPGSRKSELEFHAPLLREVAAALSEKFPKAELRLPVASTLSLEQVSGAFAGSRVHIEETPAREILQWADVALVASGTATLETALVGTPFLLFYRVSRSSAWIFKYLMRYRGFIGMPNLLRGKAVVRELFQGAATTSGLVTECEKIIRNETYRSEMARELLACRGALGERGASARAAAHVLSVLRHRHGEVGNVGLLEVPT